MERRDFMKWLICLMILGFTSLQAVFVSRSPHSGYIPSNFKYDHIISSNEFYTNKILERVKRFDFSNYEIHLVQTLGLFLLDAKPDWIKDVLRTNREWEGYIAPYIKKYAKPNTLALDIGAHIGTHTLNMSRAVGPNGKVIVFEPQPKTFCELFMNTEINGAPNIWCFWGALGDKNQELHLPNFDPRVEVTYLWDFSRGDSGNIAPMITLDSLNLNNISFMKIDVDGCDEIFLEGARETILRNKPVMIMEICGGLDIDTANPEEKATILKIQSTIKNMGYQLERISIHDYLAIPK
jgi:FkbM family methyltransferase